MPSSLARPLVVIFAKHPTPGAVKTRLAARIGPAAATAFYRQSLEAIVARLSGTSEWELVLAVTPDESRDCTGWPPGPRRVGQKNGDLGERMARFLARASDSRPVIILGSDVPELTANDLREALAALQRSDVVLGPSRDGGYWLIGASTPVTAEWLRPVRWSTPDALSDTLAALPPHLQRTMLRELEDIDDVAAYERWKQRAGR